MENELNILSLLGADGDKIRDLGVLFKNAGKDLYLVGGPVRDLILRREPKDMDFCTDATPAETKAILAPIADSLWTQGERFGTIGAEIDDIAIEITTFRTEVYNEGSRKPEVAFGTDIVEDLSRRDFTANALAVRVIDGAFVDPFGGVDDIKSRELKVPRRKGETEARATHRAFTDDPLRMLRAFRFVAQLNFRVGDTILAMVAQLRESINTISNERIRDELSKLIVAKHPARALKLMDKAGLLELILPELTGLKLTQDGEHKHKDIFAHTLAVMEQTPATLELRLVAILHDSAKPECRRFDEGGVSFHGHDIVGADKARKRLRALKYPNDVVDTVTQIIRLHHRSHTFKMGWTDAAVRRYVHEVGELRPLLHAFVRADCTTKNPKRAQNLQSVMNALEKRIIEVQEKDEEAAIRPEMNGHEVMQLLDLKPGKEVGEALEFLMYLRLEYGILGRDEIVKRLHDWAKTREVSS